MPDGAGPGGATVGGREHCSREIGFYGVLAAAEEQDFVGVCGQKHWPPPGYLCERESERVSGCDTK